VIDPRSLQEIFEPFRSLGKREPTSRSVGLGLYIARTIVAAHRGTIEVTSNEDGTTFTVRLPRGPEQRAHAA
jgi:signal transduction histidine kinase